MKYSILIFFLFCLSVFKLEGQVTFTLVKPPCVNDGELKTDFTGIALPCQVYWYYNGKSVTNTVNTNFDSINDYGGGSVYVYISSNGSGLSGTYNSDLPFKLAINTIVNPCPIPSIAEAVITGGASPYTYEWYKVNNGIQTPIGNSNPINLNKGQFEVKVTDANGCVVDNFGQKQDSTSIYINPPINFTYDVVITDANCTNGSASIENIVGGTQPFTYQWSNGANSSNISNLVTGNYPMTLTDGDGCEAIEYEVYVGQSKNIEVQTTITPASCENNDGSITAFGSGGTSPYTYAWSNGATTQSITNIAGGYYNVYVTDNEGCIGQGWANLNSISPVFVSVSNVIASSCTAPTGYAEISITGGQAPYVVVWNSSPVQTGTVLNNVPIGNYNFTVTDVNNCKRSGTVVIGSESNLSLTVNTSNELCGANNGSAQVNIFSGQAPYTYNWNTGANTPSIGNLDAGSYVVTVTDDKSCQIIKSFYINSYSDMVIGFAVTPASCKYTKDGSIITNVTGGIAPYTFSWSNGLTSNNPTGLGAGKYWLAVTDANGCVQNSFVDLDYDPTTDFCYCTIQGTVYHDVNANCTQDPGEPGIENIQIVNNNNGVTYTNANGYYSFEVPTGTYQISESIKYQYPLAPCQLPNKIVNAVASGGCFYDVNFANSLNPIHDIHISLWPDNFPVPGFEHKQNLIIVNEGTVTESNVISSYLSDNQLGTPDFYANSLFGTPTAPGFYESVVSPVLTPAQSSLTKVKYTVPTNIPIGTEVFFRDSSVHAGPMSNWLNDYTPWNNVNQRYETVVGSYDPNFMMVSPQGKTEDGIISLQDTVLEYMVHFQNYGNYFATKVVVDCQLDPNLDWMSLKPVFSTNPATVRLTETGFLTYTFDDIYLLPKNWSEELSKGFFTFSIHVKKGLKPKDQMKNFSDIYFDFNEPIRTNTAISTIEELVSTNEPGTNDMIQRIFPNPAKNAFTIEMQSPVSTKGQVQIFDLYGKLIHINKVELDSGYNKLDVSGLNIFPGMYLVNISANDITSKTYKLVIVE